MGYARTLLVRAILLAVRLYRWRAECPECGRRRHNLTAPYGWTCDNPACSRQAMPEMRLDAGEPPEQ